MLIVYMSVVVQALLSNDPCEIPLRFGIWVLKICHEVPPSSI